MTRWLCLILCLALHAHNIPHVSVHITRDRPIRVTTFAITGRGPDTFNTWLMPAEGRGLVLLYPCGKALWIGTPIPGDFDGDDDVDLADYAVFTNAFTGAH